MIKEKINKDMVKIYTDASLTVVDGKKYGYVAINIKNTDKSIEDQNYRITGIIPNNNNNINSYEKIGILIALVIANYNGYEHIFIFNDNSQAVKNVQEELPNIKKELLNLGTIQFGWLQSKDDEMFLVDFLTRMDYKQEIETINDYLIQQTNLIKYTEIELKDSYIILEDNYLKYLELNGMPLLNLLGLLDNTININTQLAINYKYFYNSKLKEINLVTLSVKDQLKYLSIKEAKEFTLINNKLEEKEEEDKIHKEDNVSEEVFKEHILKKYKKYENPIIIKYSDRKVFLKYGDKIMDFEIRETVTHKDFKKIVPLSFTNSEIRRIYNLIFLNENNNIDLKEFSSLLNSKNIKEIIIFLKIISKKTFDLFFQKYYEDKEKKIMYKDNIGLFKKDYRMGIPALIKLYNSKQKTIFD